MNMLLVRPSETDSSLSGMFEERAQCDPGWVDWDFSAAVEDFLRAQLDPGWRIKAQLDPGFQLDPGTVA
jgi:hypothetical protein